MDINDKLSHSTANYPRGCVFEGQKVEGALEIFIFFEAEIRCAPRVFQFDKAVVVIWVMVE
jgi:hypothetical protein